ncbi:MAG: RsiV family protein [Azoarcus sp.]|jgi:hypothetical protein|nr:RsiV family protein [Azoarcus sp.]
MKHILSVRHSMAALAALAVLCAFPAPAGAEDLLHPAYKTQTVGVCPSERSDATGPRFKCSRARMLYPQYKNKNVRWMNHLIAQSVMLPMFSRVLEKPQPPLTANENPDTRYKKLLQKMIRDSQNARLIEFSVKLTGTDADNLSQETGQLRPEQFGPYLQFALAYSLNQEEAANSAPELGGFVVIDTVGRKLATLDELIVPGQTDALAALQRDAFRDWLREEQQFSDADIDAHLADATFAFHPSKNWRIAADGLIFHYDMYEIGPRVFGAPEFLIAKDRLQGIVKPEVLRAMP